MLNGNAWIHHGWNGDVVNVRNQADDPSIYKFEKCKEGIPVGADQMAIPANAEHPGTAMLFIDFMLDPENAAQNVAYFGYPMPNNGAVDAFAGARPGRPGHHRHDRGPRARGPVRAPRRRAPPRLGPRLDRGEGGLSEQRFAAALLSPGALWLVLLFAIPLGLTLALSFGTTDDFGNAIYGWYPENYERVVRPAVRPGAAALGGLRARDRGALPGRSAIRSPTTSLASAAATSTC